MYCIYIYTCIDIFLFDAYFVTKIQRNNETTACFGDLQVEGLTALGLDGTAAGDGACTRTEGLERGRGDDPNEILLETSKSWSK